MTAQQQLDDYLERRQFTSLKPDTIAQVRRLCRHPESGIQIISERLHIGGRVLDEAETDSRWDLYELLFHAHWFCEMELRQRRRESEAAEIEARQTDPERANEVRRLRALNHRSTKEYLQREEGGQQVPLQEPETRQAPQHPMLIQRHRKGKQ